MVSHNGLVKNNRKLKLISTAEPLDFLIVGKTYDVVIIDGEDCLVDEDGDYILVRILIDCGDKLEIIE
ncbi:MAG: hypothetical protein [Bacteriophage sp.]|nr:MAG: hypothetical protein [Bacteriophage sp.]